MPSRLIWKKGRRGGKRRGSPEPLCKDELSIDDEEGDNGDHNDNTQRVDERDLGVVDLKDGSDE